MYKTILHIFILYFGIIGSIIAQSYGVIRGNVIDKNTKERLIGANIGILELQRGTASNTLGYYVFKDIAPDTYTLICSYIGYKTYQKTITITAGEEIYLDIEMITDVTTLEEIVVTSEEEELLRNIGIYEVPIDFINNAPPVITSDVLRSLQYVPGVKSVSDFSSGIYVRGGSPDQTLVLLDRTTVYNPTHAFGLFSTFNPDAIKAIQFYKGSVPTNYGGRIGSLLHVFNKDGNRNEFEGSAHLDLLTTRLSFGGPFKKGVWYVGGRRSILEPLLGVLDLGVNPLYFYDLNAKVSLDLDRNNFVNVSVYLGRDKLGFQSDNSFDINWGYGNQTMSVNWSHNFGSNVFSYLTFTYSNYNNTALSGIATTEFSRNNDLWDLSLIYDLEITLTSNYQLDVGIIASSILIKNEESFDVSYRYTSRNSSKHVQGYIRNIWTPIRRVKIDTGIRAHYYSLDKLYRLAPRISIDYTVSPQLRLQTAYGKYYQFITLVTNQVFSGLDVWYAAGNGVRPSYGEQFSLGIKWTPNTNTQFDIEGYYRNMNDLITYDPFLGTGAAATEGLEYAEIFRTGIGYAYGIETNLKYNQENWDINIGYTYAITRRKFDFINISINQKEENWFAPRYDKPHQLTAIFNWKPWRNWTFSFVFTYSTGQPYTQPIARAYAYIDNRKLDYLIIENLGASRIPDYHRMDLAINRKNLFGLNGDFRFNFYNLYNRKNVWFYFYNLSENPIKEPTVLNYLPIIPSISYTIYF